MAKSRTDCEVEPTIDSQNHQSENKNDFHKLHDSAFSM